MNRVCILGGIGLALLLAGCGGSGSGKTSGTGDRKVGDAKMRLQWPVSSRMIPQNVQQYLIVLTKTNQATFQEAQAADKGVVDISFSDLDPGVYFVKVGAYGAAQELPTTAALPNTYLAYGFTKITVSAGETTDFTVTLSSKATGLAATYSGNNLFAPTTIVSQDGNYSGEISGLDPALPLDVTLTLQGDAGDLPVETDSGSPQVLDLRVANRSISDGTVFANTLGEVLKGTRKFSLVPTQRTPVSLDFAASYKDGAFSDKVSEAYPLGIVRWGSYRVQTERLSLPDTVELGEITSVSINKYGNYACFAARNEVSGVLISKNGEAWGRPNVWPGGPSNYSTVKGVINDDDSLIFAAGFGDGSDIATTATGIGFVDPSGDYAAAQELKFRSGDRPLAAASNGNAGEFFVARFNGALGLISEGGQTFTAMTGISRVSISSFSVTHDAGRLVRHLYGEGIMQSWPTAFAPKSSEAAAIPVMGHLAVRLGGAAPGLISVREGIPNVLANVSFSSPINVASCVGADDSTYYLIVQDITGVYKVTITLE
jgi:hypothetical protein